MSVLSIFRRSPGDTRTLAPVATAETFESRFWTAMVIIAFFFFYLFKSDDHSEVGARA